MPERNVAGRGVKFTQHFMRAAQGDRGRVDSAGIEAALMERIALRFLLRETA
jgi:hypothetical protein